MSDVAAQQSDQGHKTPDGDQAIAVVQLGTNDSATSKNLGDADGVSTNKVSTKSAPRIPEPAYVGSRLNPLTALPDMVPAGSHYMNSMPLPRRPLTARELTTTRLATFHRSPRSEHSATVKHRQARPDTAVKTRTNITWAHQGLPLKRHKQPSETLVRGPRVTWLEIGRQPEEVDVKDSSRQFEVWKSFDRGFAIEGHDRCIFRNVSRGVNYANKAGIKEANSFCRYTRPLGTLSKKVRKALDPINFVGPDISLEESEYIIRNYDSYSLGCTFHNLYKVPAISADEVNQENYCTGSWTDIEHLQPNTMGMRQVHSIKRKQQETLLDAHDLADISLISSSENAKEDTASVNKPNINEVKEKAISQKDNNQTNNAKVIRIPREQPGSFVSLVLEDLYKT